MRRYRESQKSDFSSSDKIEKRWSYKIEEIMQSKGYSVRRMAQLCKVSEPAVRKWRRGSLPQRRDMYIRIGFAAGYNLEEMNVFLKRYSKRPQLYVESLEYSVFIYALRSDTLDHTYNTYQHLLDLVRQELQGATAESLPKKSHRNTPHNFCLSVFSCRRYGGNNFICSIQHPAFRKAYDMLCRSVDKFLAINLGNEYLAERDGRKASFHSMAVESRWSSSLKHCISEIRQRKLFPLRHKVISLGLHLNMATQNINDLLEYVRWNRSMQKSY